jgi:hypothetical protein
VVKSPAARTAVLTMISSPQQDVSAQHRVFITGTGRAGTTFLVRLLTELGFDTGFTPDSWRRDFHEHCQAGLEREPDDPDGPYIVKNPQLCETLDELAVGGRFVIDHVFVPVREVEAAALSRVRVGGGDVPGGLWHAHDSVTQKAALALLFHRLVHTLVEHDIPHTFLHFPRLVLDADYAYEKLSFLVRGIEREVFRAVFARLAQPELVHRFDARGGADATAPVADEGRPARCYLATQRRRKRLRRLGRGVLWAATVAMATAAGYRWGTADSHDAVARRPIPEVASQ